MNLQLRVLDLDPDLLIVYHGVNGVAPRLVWPPAAYRGDNTGRWLPSESPVFMPSIFEHSTLLRVLMIRFGITRSHASLSRVLAPEPESFVGDDFVDQKLRGDYPSRIFSEVDAAEMLQTNSPVFFERNIGNMVAVAKSHNIGIVLRSFAISPDFPSKPYVSSDEYARAYLEINAMLRRLASATSVPSFDFAAVFPSGPDLFTDGLHVNDQGALLKAELFGRFLIASALVPLAPVGRRERTPRASNAR